MSAGVNSEEIRRVVDVAKAIVGDLPRLPAERVDWSTGTDVLKVVAALQQFGECVRYLNNRRAKGTVMNIKSEADVQDAIYLMLRPWVHDLVWENPTDKIGGRYTIKDFLSKQLKVVVEGKYVRDRNHGKNISAELHDDIENYRHYPDCETLVFFIYDPDTFIADVPGLQKHIETKRTYDGKQLTVYCVVKP
ncbi:MAG: hypothetical protein ABR920_08340 [Terriglobales bacterium]